MNTEIQALVQKARTTPRPTEKRGRKCKVAPYHDVIKTLRIRHWNNLQITNFFKENGVTIIKYQDIVNYSRKVFRTKAKKKSENKVIAAK